MALLLREKDQAVKTWRRKLQLWASVEKENGGGQRRGLPHCRINTQTISGLMVKGRRKVLEGLVTAEVLGRGKSEVMGVWGGGEGCDAHGHPKQRG